MRVLLSILFVLICTNAQASWYVIRESDNKVVSKTEYLPDATDLDSRGEYSLYSDSDLGINEAENRDGKIKQRTKSQEEKNAERKLQEEADEQSKIRKRADKIAYEELKAEGVVFKQKKDSDFE